MSEISFTKGYIGLSSKVKYRWDNSYHSGAGKYRDYVKLIFQNNNSIFSTLGDDGKVHIGTTNKLTIALNGTLSSNIYNELVENLLSKDNSDISEYLSIHQLDVTFIAMVLPDTQIPTYYCYSGTTSSPIYVGSRIEKQYLMAGISSEVKCLSSKFDLSRKNDDCIRKLKSNNLLVVCPYGTEQLYTENIKIISPQPLPRYLSLHSNSLNISDNRVFFAIHNNKLYCNSLISCISKLSMYNVQNNNKGILVESIDNLRTLIYFMETNRTLPLILQYSIELIMAEYYPTLYEITLIGNSDDELFIYSCQTIRKISSRYKMQIKHEYITSRLINHYIENALLKEITTKWDNSDINSELLINDIYCEFFGEINRGGKLDQETIGINKINEKDNQSATQESSKLETNESESSNSRQAEQGHEKDSEDTFV